jgi:hypothetical protein
MRVCGRGRTTGMPNGARLGNRAMRHRFGAATLRAACGRQSHRHGRFEALDLGLVKCLRDQQGADRRSGIASAGCDHGIDVGLEGIGRNGVRLNHINLLPMNLLLTAAAILTSAGMPIESFVLYMFYSLWIDSRRDATPAWQHHRSFGTRREGTRASPCAKVDFCPELSRQPEKG